MEASTSSLVEGNLNGSISSMYENGLENSQSLNISQSVLPSMKEYVKIIEQPASKALRFRYECEGRSAGSIPGASSTSENKTYPTIQVEGYVGRAVVVVSCVTKDEPFRPHPHNLVGREGCKKGVCTLEIPPDTMTVSFSNLGIQCVKKKDIEVSLKTREEIRVDPFRTGFSHRNHPTSIDLNALRLCFQVFLEGDKQGKFTVPLTPVVSEPIFDKKATADLVIVKMSDCNSYVDGGRKDIILLCEKVSKEDIQIRFFEEKDGVVVWEAYGDFQSNQVHKQTAIWFRTPRYRTLEVTEPVKAFIQLKRPSDGVTSEALPFELLPLDAGRPSYWSLGRSLRKKGNYNLFTTLLNSSNVNLINKWQPEENKEMSESVAKTLSVEKDIPEVNEVEMACEQNIIENVPNHENMVTENIIHETNNNEINITDIELQNITNGKDTWKVLTNENSEEKSFNQLIDEVAELDEIYSLSHCNKNTIDIEENVNFVADTKNTSFDDTKTYSSLQLAFRNPLELAYRPLEEKPQNVFQTITEEKQTNKRESPVDKLPPLPPKRQKKVETYIGDDEEEAKRLKEALLHPKPLISRSHSFSSGAKKQNDDLKYLGSTSTLPNPKKRGFFSKLFGRKNKNKSSQDLNVKKESYCSTSLRTTDKNDSKITSKSNENICGSLRNTPVRSTPPRKTENIEIISNTSNLIRNSISSQGRGSVEVSRSNLEVQNFDLNLDLTEAEHYALYTAMAPHATQSEFDEMSCYYAAVEGGKIIS
ncbi:hypothetical protein HHI36_010730 [Cryptolaemus montrouzieri]|uniref:RHD domain-containing protein n=1 Tax=Cryptolaemus montrouzieri TaxID=559131 RepID=A0ABD2MJR0_9CUCU